MDDVHHIEAHDPRHQANADLQDKGLSHGAVWLVDSIVLGDGLTAFACVWYFRRELFASTNDFVFKLGFPLVGGLMLAYVFYVSVRDSFDPAYGSGAAIGGVGLVFILGLGLLAAGAVVMLVWRAMAPEFFRGEVLKHDTPSLVVEE